MAEPSYVVNVSFLGGPEAYAVRFCFWAAGCLSERVILLIVLMSPLAAPADM